MDLPGDSTFWIRAILFAALIASMASYVIRNWGLTDDARRP